MLLIVAKLKRTLSARQFSQLLDRYDLGKKRSTQLLKKTGVSVDGTVVIRPPFYFERGNLTLGRGVFINSGCVLLDQAPIVIGDDVMLGPQVRLCTTTHDTRPDQRKTGHRHAPISIGHNAWLGAGVVVLPGVTIGANSVIAANSVVTQDVPENAMYAGAPARFKKWLVEPVQSSSNPLVAAALPGVSDVL
ncbi:sugar O-acetyltransferase [Pseudomonas sp. NPDC090202]|uniref:sugar O-acetyltransferase n=1 Tax=unclassified Pseudomonas TaxID=196821 RepID=UPI00380AA975